MKIKMYATFGWLFVPLITMAGPSRVMDLSASSTNGGTVLAWTAPTPSGVTTLSSIDVRYDTSPYQYFELVKQNPSCLAH